MKKPFKIIDTETGVVEYTGETSTTFKGKRWVIYESPNRLYCPCCRDEIEVYTKLSDKEIKEGIYTVGDEVKCVDHRCKLKDCNVSGDLFKIFWGLE